MKRVTVAVAVAVVALVLSLSGLSGEEGRTVPTYDNYVAIGDSFTAAPFVPVTDIARGCFRSANNYPRQLAASLRIDDLRDNSCKGATTDDTVGRQRTAPRITVPAQFQGLTEHTDLVTIGLGFNNHRLYARMNSLCRRGNRICRLADERDNLRDIVDQVQPALERVIDGVKERSPDARILLVTYPRLLPGRGTCAELPRYRPQDRETYRDIQSRLRRQMLAAAQETGVELIDFYRHSVGHDICSRHPWVEGKVGSRYRAAPLHPMAAGQRALARIIETTLRRPPPERDD